MEKAENITREEIVDLLNKCWMTHDGMWFFHCVQNFGIEVTNKVNKSAIKTLSSIEIGRVRKALDCVEPIKSFDEFKDFFNEASKLMIPNFMNVTFKYSEENKMEWEFKQDRCFAYKGIKMIGVIEDYECGVLYRIKCWLDELGIENKFVPEIGKCQMLDGGTCSGEIQLFF